MANKRNMSGKRRMNDAITIYGLKNELCVSVYVCTRWCLMVERVKQLVLTLQQTLWNENIK